MRPLAILALTLTALSAQAETGPPTPEELARAKADCAVKVGQDCLLILALSAALEEERRGQQPRVLNEIATAQAKAGDAAGSVRTLSLTHAEECTLLALGRWDEAYAAAETQFPLLIVEQATAEGSFKTTMVRGMLEMGEVDLALATAGSIADGWGERDGALFLIFDHQLRNRDYAAATKVYGLMQDRDNHRLGQALATLVDALSIAGQVDQAAMILDRADDLKAEAEARLRPARALLEVGATESAKAQFDQVFVSATKQGLPDWGLSILIDAADVALSLGQYAIALQHAEAAFGIVESDKKTVGSWHIHNASNPINVIRVATVLQLSGSTDKAKTLFGYTASPPQDRENGQQGMLRQIELLISQLRLDEQDAANLTLQQLLLPKDGPDAWVLGSFLNRAALSLVDYGLFHDAQHIAEVLETLPYAAGESYSVYMALLAKDPALAPLLLPGIRSNYLQVEVTIIWAQTLHAAVKSAEAQQVLRSLALDHAGRSDSEYSLPSYRAQAMARIAKAQASIGFADDAAATQLHGLSFADMGMASGFRVTALLSLAASFP